MPYDSTEAAYIPAQSALRLRQIDFPRPTMLRLEGVPMQRDCTLLCYDTAGECFERPTQLVQFADFVRRAQTVLLLVSRPDLEDENAAADMQRLLNTYVIGMHQLEARPHDQRLLALAVLPGRTALAWNSS